MGTGEVKYGRERIRSEISVEMQWAKIDEFRILFPSKIMFYSTSRLFYRPIATQINALEGRISYLQKKRNLPEAISLFRELVATGSVPSDRTLSSLLHMCQVCLSHKSIMT